MFSKKVIDTFKAGLGYFTSSAGGVSFVIGLITLFVAVSFPVSVPIILTVGAFCGAYGAYQKYQKIQENEKADIQGKQIEMEEKQERVRIVEIEKEQARLLNVTKHIEEMVEQEQKQSAVMHQRHFSQGSLPHLSNMEEKAMADMLFFAPSVLDKGRIDSDPVKNKREIPAITRSHSV